ncbi:hypothetical protein [Magnetovibrio sp.]|uniref:hypothetical protein n=1 Tax=Magnetovibrio sp. TaxID=2024836 RepID=UPI002F955632
MTLKSSKPIKLALGLLVTGAVAGLVSACASQGTTDNPVMGKLSWFSYMEGGDIRATCGPGAANRYRLVYNGVYTEQVRTYEWGAADQRLNVGVTEAVDITQGSVGTFNDLLNPWRAKTASRTLSDADATRVVSALERDGVFGPPAVGTELSSKGFFWTVASCHDGAYRFTAVAWPSPSWDAMTFDDVVFDLDPSPIAVNPPRKTDTRRDTKRGRYGHVIENEFHTKVGENGLFGVISLGQ